MLIKIINKITFSNFQKKHDFSNCSCPMTQPGIGSFFYQNLFRSWYLHNLKLQYKILDLKKGKGERRSEYRVRTKQNESFQQKKMTQDATNIDTNHNNAVLRYKPGFSKTISTSHIAWKVTNLRVGSSVQAILKNGFRCFSFFY